ncbi:D-glycero-alpha-D-manno-heptose-1,7-bisphosphate 7-phosphatase [Bacillus mobilis]|uniref:D-glycero-alpha-D-manno-heptose-1,7-bisphosphate 7-phosphatase n=1 Tax=Bacillus mobilis TaxID=2026190 RepID=UPI0039A2ABBE
MKNIDNHELIQRIKAVFLDRDGVLNEIKSSRVNYVNIPQDIYLLPGTADAIARIREKGYLIFIVTNQAGVSLGYMNHTQLNDIHKHLEQELIKVNANAVINEVVACTHNIKANCNCRKPNAGMLITLAEKYNISLDDSYMIGDRESDIEAGIKAGTKTIHISQQIIETKVDEQYATLFEASLHIK